MIKPQKLVIKTCFVRTARNLLKRHKIVIKH